MSDESTDRPILALLVRIAGIAGFALMAALIKLASQRGMHIAEIIFWRQLVTVPILLVWAMAAGGITTLATTRPKAHVVRAFYGIAGMICNFGAVILLPLAEAQTINFSAPIFAVLLSIVLLKETVGVWRWSAVAAGFAGILVIAQPGSGHFPIEGALVALGGAFMIALISIQIRDLSRTDKPLVIVFWFAAVSVLVFAPILPFVMQAHSAQDWLLLLAIGLAGTWGQLLVTVALRLGKVSSVIVMDYTAIVWATLLGWTMFDAVPPASTWLGAPLIVGAGLIIAWRERTIARKKFADQRQATGT